MESTVKSLTSQYNCVHIVEHSSVNYADSAQCLLVLVMRGDAECVASLVCSCSVHRFSLFIFVENTMQRTAVLYSSVFFFNYILGYMCLL